MLYLWLVINPDVAEATRFNAAVPLLAVVAGSLIAKALRRQTETAQYVQSTPAPASPPELAAAA